MQKGQNNECSFIRREHCLHGSTHKYILWTDNQIPRSRADGVCNLSFRSRAAGYCSAHMSTLRFGPCLTNVHRTARSAAHPHNGKYAGWSSRLVQMRPLPVFSSAFCQYLYQTTCKKQITVILHRVPRIPFERLMFLVPKAYES